MIIEMIWQVCCNQDHLAILLHSIVEGIVYFKLLYLEPQYKLQNTTRVINLLIEMASQRKINVE